MVKDARFDLGRYVSNPFNKRGHIPKRLDFNELFVSKAKEGEYPWNPSRFGSSDLLKKAQSRKMTLNPELNFVGNSPFFDQDGAQMAPNDYEMLKVLEDLKDPLIMTLKKVEHVLIKDHKHNQILILNGWKLIN